MMEWLFIDELANSVRVQLPVPAGDTLSKLQHLVRGLVTTLPTEITWMGSYQTAWVNDEGLLVSMSHNMLGSALMGQDFVGPLVVTGYLPQTGDTSGLPARVFSVLERQGLDIVTMTYDELVLALDGGEAA